MTIATRKLTAYILEPAYSTKDLGMEPNVFSTELARNAQQSADSNWLSSYQPSDGKRPFIRVGEITQRRNAAGDDWENADVSAIKDATITALMVSPRDIPITNRAEGMATAVPHKVTACTDADGMASLFLVPTKQLEYDSRYRIMIAIDGRETQRFMIRMPDADKDLHELDFIQ